MLTDRDIELLLALVRYYVLNRLQIQRLIFPTFKDGRVCRRRLQFLVDSKFINRQNVQMVSVNDPSPPRVYFPAIAGCQFLAAHFDDERYLLTPTRAPAAHHVQHWLAVSDTHILFDAAVAQHGEVRIDGWLNEWDVANKDEASPENHYRLYTIVRHAPKIVCVPDSAFLLSLAGHKKVFYIEQDRATSGVQQVVAQKHQGYALMATSQLHARHFPDATVPSFSVLMITPNPSRRDSLRAAMRGKPGAELWKFVTTADMKADSLFTAPIFWPCDGDPRPLLKPTTEGT